jgi:hypothetical protein
MCPFLPDSPRLLIRKGKHEDALDVLAALEGHGATRDSPSVRTQYDIIKDVLDKEHSQTYTWWQLLTGRGPSGVVRRMILGAWMQAMNQISGINVTSYVSTLSSLEGCPFGLRCRSVWLRMLHTNRLLPVPNIHLHPRDQPYRTRCPNPRCRRICRLPHIQFPGVVRH